MSEQKIERHWITSDKLGLSSEQATLAHMEQARHKAIMELFRDVIYKTRIAPPMTVAKMRLDPPGPRGTVGVVLAPCSEDYAPMSRLYVWKDCQLGAGSKFGGTLCCVATCPADARLRVIDAFTDNPSLSGYDDMYRPVATDGSCAWDWLKDDLKREPEVRDVSLAFGGDD